MFQIKVVDKTKTQILFSITSSTNRAVYEIMWKNMVERGRPQMAIQYGAYALIELKQKTTDTESELCNVLLSTETMVTRTRLTLRCTCMLNFSFENHFTSIKRKIKKHIYCDRQFRT
jgi:hypothetical protein